jgi:hypothetical protein
MRLDTIPSLAADAIATSYAFWSALADDDDDGMRILLSPFAYSWAEQQGGGVAAAIRGHRDITPEHARELGRVDPIEVLAGRRLRIAFTWYPADVPRSTQEFEIVWRLELADTPTGWTIDPIKAHIDEPIGFIWTAPRRPKLTLFPF